MTKSKSKNKTKKSVKKPNNLNKQLKRSSVSAIIYAALILPVLLVAPIATQTIWLKIVTLILVIVTTGLLICVLKSFCNLTNKWKNKFAKLATRLMVIIALLVAINDIVSIFTTINLATISIILSVLTGIIYVLFGIALIHLKAKAGSLVKALGIIFIIAGIFSGSLVLLLLVPTLLIAISVMEAVLFHDLIKK